MRIIALMNQKGGCGKTTTAVNLSAYLAHHGKRVLLVDLDPQGHASLALGSVREETSPEMASVLLQEASLDEIAVKGICPNLDLAPSNLRLAALEQQLSCLPQREERFLWALQGLQRSYDFIIVDSPPSLGILSFNALRVADEVLVPVESSTFSIHGLDRLLETVELVQSRTRQPIEVKGLATLSSRTRFAHEMIEALESRFAERLSERFHGGRYRTVIRTNVRLKEAASHGLPILHYDEEAIGAQDYACLAEEVLLEEAGSVFPIREAAGEAPPGPSFLADGVLFTWIGSEEVAVAGEFNDWVPDRKLYPVNPEGENQGRVQKWLPRRPGHSVYRIRINGAWREDPFNPNGADDISGGRGSILESPDSAPRGRLEGHSTPSISRLSEIPN
jgi:chromosome partitioning protein